MERQKVNTKVTGVEIFLEGGMVKREGTIKLKPGVNNISILGMTDTANEDTVKIEVEGKKYYNVEITSYKAEEYAQGVKEIDDLVGELAHKITIKEQQKSLWTVNSDFSQREKADYEEISRFITNYADNVYKLEKELDELRVEHLKKTEEIKRIMKKYKQKIVNIDIENDKEEEVPVIITYFENAMCWKPIFELHAQENKAIIKNKGKIIQRTPDVWEKVKVELSTGMPTGSQEIPEIVAPVLKLEESYERMWRRKGFGPAMRSSRGDYDCDFSVMESYASEKESKNEMLAQMNDQRIDMDTTTSYDLNGTWTIDNVNDGIIAELYQYEVAMTLKRVFIPKRTSNGYLAGEIKTKDLSELNGHEVEVYYKGNYVGKIFTELNFEEEKNFVSLGIDEKLKSTRKEEDTHSKGLKNKHNKKTVITVSSSKQENCEVIVKDYLPKTNNKDINISDIKLDGGQLNEETNIVEWTFVLKPGEIRNITTSYDATYPLKKSLVKVG